MRPPRAQPSRLEWADTARGISIIGVVVFHACMVVPEAEHTALGRFSSLLDPLRMPLFFLVAGLFSGGYRSRTWGELSRRRLWFLFVPWIVWSPLELWLTRLAENHHEGAPLAPFSYNYAVMLTDLHMYWFLLALMVFTVFCRLTGGLHPALALALSGVPLLLVVGLGSCATGSPVLAWLVDLHLLGQSALYLPVFMMGVLLRHPIEHRAARPSRWTVAVALVLGVGSSMVAPAATAHVDAAIVPAVRFVHHLLMLPLGILPAVALSWVPVVGRALSFLGRVTLPIYLAHPLAIALVFRLPGVFQRLEVGSAPGSLLQLPTFWLLMCLAASAAATMAMVLMQRIPVLGWTIVPPPLPDRARITTM